LAYSKGCHLYLSFIEGEKMIKNDLLIKIVDFHQPFEIKRKRAGTIKSLIAQRAKLNHPLFKSTQSRCNKNHFPTDCIFDNNSK